MDLQDYGRLTSVIFTICHLESHLFGNVSEAGGEYVCVCVLGDLNGYQSIILWLHSKIATATNKPKSLDTANGTRRRLLMISNSITGRI